jgi:hypothetical protein
MKKNQDEQILTVGLRESLKVVMQKEIEKLPTTLEALEPKDRLNVLCKLMPYVFPRVETIHPTEGEPINFGNWQ